jgi:hypothetical protein
MSTKSETVKKSLKDFGYAFNEKGQLRQLDPNTGEVTDKAFDFNVSGSQSENQKNYEALGEVITEHVYGLLDEHGLHRIYLPADVPQSQATFVFSSKKEFKDVDKLMVIIHGSGVVRAGQWARSLIINHCLDSGTILPYIKEAEKRGYEVVVTNTNDNRRDGHSIKGSRNPEEHANTVWETIIQPANAKSIAVVAHSYGGHVAHVLSKNYKEDFEKKVFVVALTDSVGSSNRRLDKIGTNFVSSNKPAGTPLRSDGMPLVSAGHPKHEMTS